MKKILYLLFAAILLSFSACDDDPSLGNVELNFQAQYDGAPLVMYANSYDYEDNIKFKAHLYQFYLSDIELLKEGSEEGELLSEIELVKFADQTDMASAEAGVTLGAYDQIPSGTYKAIRFGLGVAADMNATDPGNYTPPHPLTDNYWSWATGYVFSKFEGIADLNDDGMYDDGLTFHNGKDEVYTVLTFNKEIVVPKNGTLTLTFTADLLQTLEDSEGNYINFRETQIDHSNDPAIYVKIEDNLSKAIHLK